VIGPDPVGESMSWTVHKFGGSSLASAEAYRTVGTILGAQGDQRQAIVVSAMAGVTDALIDLASRAGSRDPDYRTAMERLAVRQVGVVESLLPRMSAETLAGVIRADLDDIADLLRALWLMQAPPKGAIDLVSGYGEIWSAQLLAAHLEACGRSVTWLDARRVLIVEPGELAPMVRWDSAIENLRRWLTENPCESIVVTGFVASDASGVPTTLGRNGSDYSASIFARMLEATAINIWTDVDGVLSADPRQVRDALVLDELSYDEAMELAYFGAKVLHPSTMAPAVEQSIPIRIRNTFNPLAEGTRIHAASSTTSPVKGFATIDGMALLNLEGAGMIGVPGIAERLFRTLREAGVSVVMISQGSSEHSICFTIPASHAADAREAIEDAFELEQRHGQIQSLDVVSGCSILAVVGDTMSGTPGVAASFFGALGRAGVNVKAIAQGSSERNISVVIDEGQATRALRAVHAGFYLSEQTLSIGLIGPGLVGRTLLEQLAGQNDRLRREFRVDLRLRAVANSREMLLDDRQIAFDGWSEPLGANGEPVDLDRLAEHVLTDSMPHAVIIDCTADEGVAHRYADWLARGIHVITPNKKAGTSGRAYYERLRDAGRHAGKHYLYETTVGAALPILQTLRDLILTGDQILEIEGVLSGTLSYLFNGFDGSVPFSKIVREAKQRGYTEPDPRDDLSGMDVARKVVILAREMGTDLELADVEIESLVPSELESASAEEFLDGISRFDDRMRRRFEEARSQDEVLRYVGSVEPGGGSSARLRSYPLTHPFARIRQMDNIVLFRTRRYHENPLVVQGPGAGPEVTAAGVFADLLRLASYLGATL
jgi:aspartokinase/homoserine dehydrogenase 1